ncbi:MAG TPA: sigma-70 family RNA polymerase sigma factor [Ktedonobacterales bacterium]|nr:sigma-70 family RNA polymerase sigma factor [Ktedonobacterales bacterium]
MSMTQVGVWEVDRVADEPVDSDSELLARIAHGDRIALELLYARVRLSVFQYLMHLTSDPRNAEELLQDTLVAVWKNAHAFAGKSSVRAWIFGIARQRAFKRLRRREPVYLTLEVADAESSGEMEPETALLASANRAELARALDQLSTGQREVLLLTFVHQLSYKEIAEVMNVPIGTIKSRLNGAKRSLRQLLYVEEEAGDEH